MDRADGYDNFSCWYAALLRKCDRAGLMEAAIEAGESVWRQDYDDGMSPERSFAEGFEE